jgi:hypothetical protein
MIVVGAVVTAVILINGGGGDDGGHDNDKTVTVTKTIMKIMVKIKDLSFMI